MHEMSTSAFFEGAALVDSEGFRWRCLQPPEIKHLVHNQAVYASAGRVGRSLLAPAAPYRFLILHKLFASQRRYYDKQLPLVAEEVPRASLKRIPS